MDLTNSTVKTPEPESETPTRTQPPPPFSNGVLKRHSPLTTLHPPVVVTYKECLKNHAAALGGHAIDGCGEFLPSPASNPTDPTSLKCAACGCHRNFHRREPEEPQLLGLQALEYRPHNRHQPLPPPAGANSGDSPNNSPSPPPISSSYYPPAQHVLLALSHGPSDGNNQIVSAMNPNLTPLSNSNGRKRFRTKFTQNQKEKMLELAERVGWKMQKRDEDLINELCGEIGVDRGVFKVWMHNNKNTLSKKDAFPNSSTGMSSPTAAAINGNGINYSAIRAAAAAAEEHFRQQNEEEDSDRKEVDGQQLSHGHITGINGCAPASN